MEFEVAYLDFIDKHVSRYSSMTPSTHIRLKKNSQIQDILLNL